MNKKCSCSPNQICGGAFTPYVCNNCEEGKMYSMTCVPKYCDDCAYELNVCNHCGGILPISEQKERNLRYFINTILDKKDIILYHLLKELNLYFDRENKSQDITKEMVYSIKEKNKSISKNIRNEVVESLLNENIDRKRKYGIRQGDIVSYGLSESLKDLGIVVGIAGDENSSYVLSLKDNNLHKITNSNVKIISATETNHILEIILDYYLNEYSK